MMDVQTEQLNFDTKGYNDIINLTDDVQKVLTNSDFEEGSLIVFCVGSTGAISTLEYEPGLVNHDIANTMEDIAPYEYDYEHHKTWGDDNGASHVRSTMVGTSMEIPFQSGEMILGTWQQIVFIDFDTNPRSRKVIVQMKGVKS